MVIPWPRKPRSWPAGSSSPTNGPAAPRRPTAGRSRSDPGMIAAHKELIYIFGMQFRRQEVDAEFKALARLAPLTHHELLTWGFTHFGVGGPDIEKRLEAFIQADPDDRYSRLALASSLVRFPTMEAKVERVLAPLPQNDPDALALRIELKLNHGRVDEALEMLREAPEHNAHLARLRGRFALMRGDRAAAVRYFQDALSDEPFDRASLSEIGKALRIRGDKSAAQGYLARAKSLDALYNGIHRTSNPDRENQPADLLQVGRRVRGRRPARRGPGMVQPGDRRQPHEHGGAAGPLPTPLAVRSLTLDRRLGAVS